MPSECEADEGQVLDLPLIRLGLAVPSTSFGLQAFFPSDGIVLPLKGRLGGRPSVPPLRGCPPRTARQVVAPYGWKAKEPGGGGKPPPYKILLTTPVPLNRPLIRPLRGHLPPRGKA